MQVEVTNGIAQLALTRPERGNALNAAVWNDLPGIIRELDKSGDVRAMLLTAEGAHFCTGMDLQEFASGIPDPATPAAREAFYHLALSLQETFSCLERTRFPVVAVVQGNCLGAGLELASACDLLFAARDACFRIEEINTGIMADVGALQRLPKRLPAAVMNAMAYLGTSLSAEQALQAGFVNGVYDTHGEALAAARAACEQICTKAPVAVAGTKSALRWARDHSVADALEWSARTQSALWSTQDIRRAVTSRGGAKPAAFEPLHPKPKLGERPPEKRD